MADQVTDQNQNQDQINQDLGWRAGLPDEFKEHDWAKTHGKVGDFFKDALQVKTDQESLKTKMEGAIFKPGDNATDEEKATFHKALGMPEKPEEYEFPKAEGVEHDEKMMSWARDIFYKAHLNKDQAGLISQAFDGLMQGMAEEQDETAKREKGEAEGKLKTEWGGEYDKNLELTKRAFQKFSGQELDVFLDETGTGNHPTLIKFLYEIGKAMGEDASPPGKGGGTGEPVIGIKYDMPDFDKGG